MKDKQEVRNALAEIEDEARRLRATANIHAPRERQLCNLIVNLAQIIRQDIVK